MFEKVYNFSLYKAHQLISKTFSCRSFAFTVVRKKFIKMKIFAILLAIVCIYIAFAEAILPIRPATGICKYRRAGRIVRARCPPFGPRVRCCTGRRIIVRRPFDPHTPICRICRRPRVQPFRRGPVPPFQPGRPILASK